MSAQKRIFKRIVRTKENAESESISRVLSRAVIHLDVELLRHSSNLPADSASNVIVRLFGLAPNGVFHANFVTKIAVSFYLAFSPLPVHKPSAVYFLRHFPSPHSVRQLTGVLLCGARTFLSKFNLAATA